MNGDDWGDFMTFLFVFAAIGALCLAVGICAGLILFFGWVL